MCYSIIKSVVRQFNRVEDQRIPGCPTIILNVFVTMNFSQMRTLNGWTIRYRFGSPLQRGTSVGSMDSCRKLSDFCLEAEGKISVRVKWTGLFSRKYSVIISDRPGSVGGSGVLEFEDDNLASMNVQLRAVELLAVGSFRSSAKTKCVLKRLFRRPTAPFWG